MSISTCSLSACEWKKTNFRFQFARNSYVWCLRTVVKEIAAQFHLKTCLWESYAEVTKCPDWLSVR